MGAIVIALSRIGCIFKDLRFTIRGLCHDWAFATTAIAMLALGLALNTTAFTIMEAMVYRGLPFTQRSDRVVYIGLRKASGQRGALSYADFQAWRSQAQTFEGLAFATSVGRGPTTFADRDRRPIEITARRISTNTFSLLGVHPMLGRNFDTADEAPGAVPVAIVSQRFWETRFGKRPDVVGSAAHINGVPATIVGVMPKEFVLVYEQDVWMPSVSTAEIAGSVFGRLRDGATLEQAAAELDTINRRLAAADPATDRNVAIAVETYSQAHVGAEAALTYGLLWAGAWFVLLIVCANLANLALARTIRHWRQLSMKMALGASQWRLACQLFSESVIVASVAGALAWWITTWAVARWAAATASRYLALDYSVDSFVLLYLAVIALLAAVLHLLAPLLMVLRLGAGSAIKTDAGGITQGLRGKRLGRTLVAVQMALSIVLLAGAGVLVRSLTKIVNAETGVHDPDHLLVGSLRLPSDQSATQNTLAAYFARLDAELRTIPGIAEVSFASHIPVNWVPSAPFEIEARPTDPDRDSAQFLATGSNYFHVVGAHPIAGRDFDDADQATSWPVAIVNQSFVDRFLPGEQAVGRRLRRLARPPSGEWLTVVGVVPNIIQVPSGNDQTRQHFTPLIYVPFRQQPLLRAVSNAGQSFPGQNLLLRTTVPFSRVAEPIRATIRNSDPDASLEELTTLRANVAFDRDRMDSTHAELGNHAMAGQTLALTALVLATIGLYAVVAHSVGQRTKEIGIRMAIGAAAANVRRMVIREGMGPVAIGMMTGLVISVGVNRLLQSQLVGVTPYDALTMTGAPLLLTTISLLACQVPARRAVSVDPSVALRHD
jgi:putative ABC transport system permease protein